MITTEMTILLLELLLKMSFWKKKVEYSDVPNSPGTDDNDEDIDKNIVIDDCESITSAIDPSNEKLRKLKEWTQKMQEWTMVAEWTQT